jgi:hypothetical protein
MNAELAGPPTAAGGYVHANAAFDDELGRLRLLEARYDPHTFRRADYVSLAAADPAHPQSARFDQVTRNLLAFFAASGALSPFLGRCLPSLITAARLAEAGSEAIACHRRGGSGEAELLRRSLERMSPMILSNGVAGQQELDKVYAATADPSFSFLDALSVAAWGRVP